MTTQMEVRQTKVHTSSPNRYDTPGRRTTWLLAAIVLVALVVSGVLFIAVGGTESVPSPVGETQPADFTPQINAAANVSETGWLPSHLTDLEAGTQRLAELHRQADADEISDNDARIDLLRTQISKASPPLAGPAGLAGEVYALPCAQHAESLDLARNGVC